MPDEIINNEEVVADEAVITNEEPQIKFTAVPSGAEPIAETPAEIVEAPVVETPAEEVIIAETPIVETPAEEVIIAETEQEIEDAKFLEIAKKKLGVDNITSLDDLKPKDAKKYAPEMEAFNSFIEKTGNTSYNDFLETQKDWSAESEESRLKNYIKLSNPLLNEKEVNRQYEKTYSTEGLDEELDADEILDKGINIKTDLAKANEFFEKRKQEFTVERGSDDHIPVEYREAKKLIDSQLQQQEANKAFYETERASYLSHINTTYNDDFKGLEVKLGNDEIGFENVFIKPENMKSEREYISDIDNFNNRFYKDGKLVDPVGFNNALIKEKNYDRDMNIAYNLGIAKKLEIDDKASKNIQPDNIRSIPTASGAGIKFTAEKS